MKQKPINLDNKLAIGWMSFMYGEREKRNDDLEEPILTIKKETNNANNSDNEPKCYKRRLKMHHNTFFGLALL